MEEGRDPGTRRRVGGWPIAAAITLVLGFLYYVRQILLPFVLAAAIAFVMTPLVDLLHRRVGWLPRWAAAVLLYLVLLAALGALFYLMGTLIVSDMARIAREAPQIIARTVEQLMGSGADVLGQHLDPKTVTQNVTDRLKAFLESGEAVSIAALGLTALFSTFLAAVLVLYFLISGARIVKGTLWLVPPEHRPEVAAMLAKVAPLLRRYLIGLACIVLYATSAAWIGFGAIFELPHAPLLAVIVGILELIPVIGPILSALLVGVTALQQSSIWAAAGLAGFAFLLRLSIDQLVGPLVLGKAASVHPVVVIFAFLSGAVMFGIIGLILAVPVAATIRMVLAHYYAEPIQE
ncbi:MAG: AI-2E family transporter [Alphaproteobacteria bacterium]|nr:AI-2E family transporter [Alphaproteobacteria bacterium]